MPLFERLRIKPPTSKFFQNNSSYENEAPGLNSLLGFGVLVGAGAGLMYNPTMASGPGSGGFNDPSDDEHTADWADWVKPQRKPRGTTVLELPMQRYIQNQVTMGLSCPWSYSLQWGGGCDNYTGIG